MKNIKIKSFDELELNAYLYEAKEPKAIIQIVHGMQEHGKRYDYTCKELNKHGFTCLVSDLRGHGKTAKSIEDLGKNEEDIFASTVRDQEIISRYLKNKYPDLPLYIFGHSYGSFITQKYIQVCNIAKKAIICGTTNGDNVLMKFGRIIAWFTKLKNGKHGKATLIEKMSLNSYGKGFKNNNWLSRDEAVWDEYCKDEYCGTPFPVSFYASLFANMGKLNKGIKDIPKDTKIFLIYGSADPVGSQGKEIKKLYKKYQKANLDATIKVYENGRHEILNETNKNEVLSDIVGFLS